jgi:hypothetical protein
MCPAECKEMGMVTVSCKKPSALSPLVDALLRRLWLLGGACKMCKRAK